MFREILVQATEEETKVAVLENGILAEIYVERTLEQRQVGNIYQGVVKNVLPGMQAAFVDIGLEKNAFLYVDDALDYSIWRDENGHFTKSKVRPSIRDLIKEGQELVVQIAKEPVGTKGARVTRQISLPGRYLVLMPKVDYVGVSRRIEDQEERERLKDIMAEIKPDNMGVILRTVSEGACVEEIKKDLSNLLRIWDKIEQRQQSAVGAVLLHRDVELVQRILRDIFTEDTQRMSVNSQAVYERVIEYLAVTDPHLKSKVYLSDTDNLFAKYSVDQKIMLALQKKVWLKSGGYLIIDQMEALTAIDVNTGKYIGSKNLADTVLKTNTEAACEIARQLRLRNIGGIIIIDFIDMQDEKHKLAVLEALESELRKDKVKAHVLGITSLGLVEMTRKKVRQSLSTTLEKTCPFCGGKGRVLSEETVCIQIKKKLREKASYTSADTVMLAVNPRVALCLKGEDKDGVMKLEEELGLKLVVKEEEENFLDEYEIKPLFNI